MWMFIALAACTGVDGAGDTDDTDDTDDTETSADAPDVPSANAGEGVVVIRDGGQDTTFSCVENTAGRWWEIPADYPIDGFTLQLGCGVDLSQSVALEAYLDDRAPGAQAVTSIPTSSQDEFIDTLDVNLFPDGANGFRVNAGMAFVGTVTLEQVGGDGEPGVGTFVASWTHVFPIEGGDVGDQAVERPGALAMAFNFPFAGP